MVRSKTLSERLIYKSIIYLYLILFPLGQVITTRMNLADFSFPVHPIEIVVGATSLLFVFRKLKPTKIFNYFMGFIAACTFSLLLATTFFPSIDVLYAGFYIVRLFVYSTFFLLLYESIKKNYISREKFTKALVIVSVVIAFFGWMQYLFVPDVRFLKKFGWDDHYYRIIGTYFDPTFTGIILTLGFLVNTFELYINKQKKYLIISALIILSAILLTYARAVYVALIVGILVFCYLMGSHKKVFLFPIIFLMFLLFLPRSAGGEGVNLLRSFSVIHKIDNYTQTSAIIKEYPLFGVGYNNLCAARLKYVSDIGFKSHSCSGSDSSLLLILATTGVVGMIIFINFVVKMYSFMKKSNYSKLFIACMTAIFVHSIFVNSLFYSWVLGYLAIIYATAYSGKQ